MRKVYLLFIVLMTGAKISFAVNYTWQGPAAGGDYQVSTNWTPNRAAAFNAGDIIIFNATTDMTVINIPDETVGGVTVTGAYTVELQGNSGNTLMVNGGVNVAASGSLSVSTFLSLQLNSAFTLATGTLGILPGTSGTIIINNALTINGTGNLNVDVALGNTIVSGTGSISNAGGTFACVTATAISFQTGSTYYHDRDGSTIPTATWSNGSTCYIRGVTSVAPAVFSGVDFSNFTWNCTGQTGNLTLNLPATNININGSFTMSSTGAARLLFASATTGTIRANSYLQNGGYLMLQAGAGVNTLSVANAFSHTAGTLDGVGYSATGQAVLDLKGAVTKNATWDCSSSSGLAEFTVQFSGASPQGVNINGGWTVTGSGRSHISITNKSAGGVTVAGSALQVINKTSGLNANCSMAGALSGIAVKYTRTGGGGLTLIYNATTFQTASALEFPTTNGPTNLTISNSLGVNFPPTFTRTIPGTLTMQSGNLAIGAGNNLNLTNPAINSQIVYSGGFLTTGTLTKSIPAAGFPTDTTTTSSLFPFGSGNNNRALRIFFTGGTVTAGTISVSHSPNTGTTPISLIDNGITLDKRTNTNWTISNSGISGTATATVIATGSNIGVVNNFSTLILTDASTSWGTVTTVTGTLGAPVIGKSGLSLATDLNKTLYFGGDIQNPLLIITYVWTGASGIDGDWTRPGNWTGGVGYPNASTVNATIPAGPSTQPFIKTGASVSVYQLSVAGGMTLSMQPSSIINVYDDIPIASGSFILDPTSIFGYASSNNIQNVKDLPYGSLSMSGIAQKILPATITITGAYILSAFPNVNAISNFNNFIYAGAGTQNVTPANYYNLTLTGDRGGGIVTLGTPPFNSTIDIANAFSVSGLSNFNYPPPLPLNGTTTNFSSTTLQTIPGFWYSIITNGSGDRIWDGAGATDPKHVIYTRSESRGVGANTVNGSKISLYSSGLSTTYYSYVQFYDLEISGDGLNSTFDLQGRVSIAGKFNVTRTNYRQVFPAAVNFIFNGTGDQIIYGHKSVAATNTPAFKYNNIIVQGQNRNGNVTLSPIDTIKIINYFEVPNSTTTGTAYFSSAYPGYKIYDFNAGKGFIVQGSTVNFSIGTGNVPDLKAVSGVNRYHNLTVTGGTRILDVNNMTAAGNLVVSGDDYNAATLASPGTLKIGDATGPRTFNVLGDTIMVTGTGTAANGVLDLNTGTTGATTINASGSLFITGKGQMTSSGVANGNVIFKGALPHKFQNNSSYKNDFLSFQVGDGVIGKTKLTLLTPIELIGSGTTSTTSAKLTVLPTDTLDCATFNVRGNGANVDFAKFSLQASATLVTANTGGIEGTAGNPSTGTIVNNTTLTKTYDSLASYIFNASSATNMNFPTTPATFTMANLTIGDSVTNTTFNLNKPIAISGILTLRRNGFFALGGSDVTLISTASNTARVAPVQPGASVSYTGIGRFNVERNYRGLRRAWYLVTAPLSATGSVFDTWQNGGVNAAGRGTFVTGTVMGTGSAGNGLDNGPYLNSSLKVGSSVTVVNDTKATLLSSAAASAANNAFFLFVRGDRTTLANYNTSTFNATTLSSRGKIQIGAQSFPASSTAGAFNIIGNPYASPVSFANTIKTNLDNNTVYVWDPYLNSTLGAYATIILDNAGIVTNIIPGSPGVLAVVGQPLTFQSSQAFWVRTATNGAASLQFNEADKSTLFNAGTFRQMRDLIKSFQTNLNLIETNDSILLSDGNLAQFDDQFGKEVNFDDLLKFGNIKETFGLLRDGKYLAVERRPEITANDTLFFKLTKTEKRNYQFQFVPTNMAGILTAFLEDSYTKAKTAVSLSTTSTFNFTINGDAASAAADRFKIVFSSSVASPLPVTYKSIKAYQQGDNIAVDWTVENEINISKYEVEKSTDGTNFTTINTTTAKSAGGSIGYSFIDNKPVEGNNYYRIKNYNQVGSFDYSRIVAVKMGKTVSGISIYPNPVTGNSIGLAITNMAQGIYQVRLINTIGQTIMTKRINHSTGNSMETLTPDSQLSPGIYQLEVTAPDKRISSVKVIVHN